MIEEQVWSAWQNWKATFTIADTFFNRSSKLANLLRRDFREFFAWTTYAGRIHLLNVLAVLAWRNLGLLYRVTRVSLRYPDVLLTCLGCGDHGKSCVSQRWIPRIQRRSDKRKLWVFLAHGLVVVNNWHWSRVSVFLGKFLSNIILINRKFPIKFRIHQPSVNYYY